MHSISVCIASVPHGILTQNGIDDNEIVEQWSTTEKGRWVKENAKEIITEVNDIIESGFSTYTVNIIAVFDKESYIKYKLMYLS
tara:strand:- start:948 stop:1199 length:252 start_codon:yes stop_codon:yes gene_type:complete